MDDQLNKGIVRISREFIERLLQLDEHTRVVAISFDHKNDCFEILLVGPDKRLRRNPEMWTVPRVEIETFAGSNSELNERFGWDLPEKTTVTTGGSE